MEIKITNEYGGTLWSQTESDGVYDKRLASLVPGDLELAEDVLNHSLESVKKYRSLLEPANETTS